MLVATDSLTIYQRLKAAKLNEKAAKGIAGIFSDVIENNLATKRDRKELEIKIEQMKNQMILWFIGSFIAALAYLTAVIRWAK